MSGLDLDVIQRLTGLALEHDEPYLAARLMPILAAHQPAEPRWLMGYLRVLTRLGLCGAAAALIRRLNEPLRSAAEVAELEQRVTRGSSGLIPWSSRRRRFEANLACLASRDPKAADRVREAALGGLAGFELHQCADGNFQVYDSGRGNGPHPRPVTQEALPDGRGSAQEDKGESLRAAGNSPRSGEPPWRPALDDHRGLAGQRVGQFPAGVIPPALLFDGVGLGWEILDAYQRTSRVFLEASSSIYVVEPRPEALAIVMHVHDWRELIADPRVTFFVGVNAAAEFAAFLESDPARPVAGRVYSVQLLGEGTDAARRMERAAQARRQEAAALRRELDRVYEGRDSAYWARRFAEAAGEDGRAAGRAAGRATTVTECFLERPLRVLGITSIHTTFLQYSMRDCLRALERLGHETRLLIEPAPFLALDPAAALRAQAEFEPDLILVLSRMRDEMTALAHAAVPAVCWDQDALPWVFSAARQPKLAWNDFLMGFSAATAPTKFGWPRHRCLYCAAAGSPDMYPAEPLPEHELAPYRCDVSYVSHASATVGAEIESVENWLGNRRLAPVYRAAVKRMLPGWLSGNAFPGPIMTAVLDAAEAAGATMTPPEAHAVGQAVGRIGDRAFRHVALEWVADWSERTGRTLHLWGNGWDRHPRLARYARGPTRNGHELRRVYQASRINLQLMAFGFLHQRALDGLMAGAFFMARRTASDDPGPALRALLELIEEYGIEDGASLATLPQAVRRRAIDIMVAFGRDPRLVTPACIVAYRQDAENAFAAEVVPHFDEVSFTGAAEFAERAERFLADAELRRRCADDMRSAIVDRFSYDVRMAGMIRFVRDGFREQCKASSPSFAGMKAGAVAV